MQNNINILNNLNNNNTGFNGLNGNLRNNVINNHNNKLKEQLIKELDEFQYKNINKFYDNSSSIDKTCPICLNKYILTDKVKELPCKHIFHKKCVKTWFQRSDSCPLCRFDLKEEIQRKKSELEKHISEAENENKNDE